MILYLVLAWLAVGFVSAIAMCIMDYDEFLVEDIPISVFISFFGPFAVGMMLTALVARFFKKHEQQVRRVGKTVIFKTKGKNNYE
jgi:hypothetical protein